MDIIAIGVARNSLDESKAYTDQKIGMLPRGIVYKGEVNYYSNLPSDAEVGDCYTVKYKGTSGTIEDGSEYIWGTYEGTEQWIKLGGDIEDGSVTTPKIADGAVTLNKLSDDIIEDLPNVGEHNIKLKTDDELRGELMAKVPSAIEDDVATFNDDGSVGDSGKKLSQFIECTDTTALRKLLADALPDTNNFPVLRFTGKIPSSGSDGGFKGEISFDSGNLYICIADNSWKKVALSDI